MNSTLIVFYSLTTAHRCIFMMMVVVSVEGLKKETTWNRKKEKSPSFYDFSIRF